MVDHYGKGYVKDGDTKNVTYLVDAFGTEIQITVMSLDLVKVKLHNYITLYPHEDICLLNSNISKNEIWFL